MRLDATTGGIRSMLPSWSGFTHCAPLRMLPVRPMPRPGDPLAGEIEALRATATLMREQIADLREDRDRWRGIAERLAIAPPAPPETPAETPPKMSLWRWLRSTG